MIGIAGFVAKRHLQAIKENSGVLVASHDINDSVGIIDSYFPESKFGLILKGVSSLSNY